MPRDFASAQRQAESAPVRKLIKASKDTLGARTEATKLPSLKRPRKCPVCGGKSAPQTWDLALLAHEDVELARDVAKAGVDALAQQEKELRRSISALEDQAIVLAVAVAADVRERKIAQEPKPQEQALPKWWQFWKRGSE